MTAVLRLGYLGIRTPLFEEWGRFGRDILGMQPVEETPDRLAFRMDDAARRLIIHRDEEESIAYYGWEVENAAALDTFRTLLIDAGYPVEPLSTELLLERRIEDGLSCKDPFGNRVELFHGLAQAKPPFTPGRALSGFRTSDLGMGHAVLNVENVDTALAFYRDILGFRLSDYTNRPFRAYFLHTNARHHSLAFIEGPHKGMHHLMIEVQSFDDMGQGHDLVQQHPGMVAATLGRHSNDHMTSFYIRTPSKFLIEYGWGGRDIDPESWEPCEMHIGPSLWGHERDWISDEMKAEARRLRLDAAAKGIRAPLSVSRENPETDQSKK